MGVTPFVVTLTPTAQVYLIHLFSVRFCAVCGPIRHHPDQDMCNKTYFLQTRCPTPQVIEERVNVWVYNGPRNNDARGSTVNTNPGSLPCYPLPAVLRGLDMSRTKTFRSFSSMGGSPSGHKQMTVLSMVGHTHKRNYRKEHFFSS